MASASRDESPSVGAAEAARRLDEEAGAFDLLQAVLLLEHLAPERARVGGDAGPADEVVRFSTNPSLSFPTGDIHELERSDDGPARMEVNFMGLVGPSGVLPHYYTQLVASTRRSGDVALSDFLDILQHRLISLFYRAWLRLHQAGNSRSGERTPVARHLLEMAGLDLPRHGSEPAYDIDRLVPLVALLAPQPRSALAFQRLLGAYFGVPVAIEQFVGTWARLRRSDLCAVGEENDSAMLGWGAVVGDEVWDPQSRVRVRLGPLPRDGFERFLPGGDDHAALRDLARLFGHDQFDVEVQLVLEREHVPSVVLGDADRGEHALGWTTWLRTAPMGRDPDEAVFTL